MDLKNNKFLTTYLVVLGVGVVGLGYFYWSSLSAHSEATSGFESAKGAVNRLEGQPLFPSEENVKKRRTQVDEYAAKASELQKQLLTMQKPLNTDISADKFQTKLAETVKTVKATAEAVKLGGAAQKSEFNLGFDRYLSSVPTRDAVADLDFALDGITALVNTLISDRVATIDSVTRTELPIENAKPAEAPTEAKKPARGAAGKGAAPVASSALDETKVIQRYPFTVRFSGSATTINDVLNHLASSKDQFYAVREIRVENERKQGQPMSAPTASTDGDAAQRDSRIVLGGERVTAEIHVDLLRFLAPEEPADPKAGGAKPTAAPKKP